jgi:hypothetical protein
MDTATLTLTASEAWFTVLGERDAATIVAEFGLTATGPALDEWLGTCEAEAARMSGNPAAMLDALAPHRGGILAELTHAIEDA